MPRERSIRDSIGLAALATMNQVGRPSGLGIDVEAPLCPPEQLRAAGGEWEKNGGFSAPSSADRCMKRPSGHDRMAASSFGASRLTPDSNGDSFFGMAPAHVLLIDHDDARGLSLAALLRGAGHVAVVDSAASGAAAALVGNPDDAAPGFDMLLLDLSLPGLDLAALRTAIAPDGTAQPDALDAAERRHIVRMLEHTGGNRRRAASLLGISRSTLLSKIRKYDIA